MATRKKTAKKATGKKASRKKTSGKKVTRKKATRKKARKATRKKATRKKAPKKAPARKAPARKKPDTAAIARKIIAAAVDPSKFVIEDLYAPDCVSIEGNGMRSEGYAGLRQKNEGWDAGLESSTWNARNVLTGPNSVAIEWDAQIRFKDGRSLQINEMAIHELRGGKIVAERYFYDPAALAPPAREPKPAPAPEPHYTPDPLPEPRESSGDDIDPMDL